MCPNLGLPDLSKLSPCAQTCVIKTLTKAKCQGPLDNKYICGLPFEFEVGLCLLGCGLGDLAPALQLQFGVCDPKPTNGQCTATGLWKILQPNCWFKVGTVKTHAARSVSNSWTRWGRRAFAGVWLRASTLRLEVGVRRWWLVRLKISVRWLVNQV